MRTRSKIRLLESESNEKSHLDGSRSNRLVEKSKTIIRGKNSKDPNKSVQSIDKNAVQNKRKRTQTKSNSDTLTSVSNKKRKRDEDNISKNDIQSQCAVVKTEALLCNSNNRIVPESRTVNRELRRRVISQTKSSPNTLSSVSNRKTQRSEQSVTNAKTNKHKRDDNGASKIKPDNFLEISSDFAFCHATQSQFIENKDEDVPSSRPVRMKKVVVPWNSTDYNHRSKKPNLQIVRKVEMKKLEKIDIGSTVLVKWPSYPYWPARIVQVLKNDVVVIFFGDNNRTAKVKNDRIFDFHLNYEYIINILKTSQWKCVFTKAIRETKIYLQIPLEYSVNNFI